MEHFRPQHFSRLKHLAVFAMVAEAGSFTATAKRLGIAKSAVSRYVSELEEHLGVLLLRRTTRRLVLTETGERVLADSARLLEAAVDSFDAVAADAPLQGTLNIGATYAFGSHVVLPASQSFLEQNPDLSIHMSLNDRFVDLATHGIDLTFRIGSPGDVPSYISRKIGSMRFELFASPTYVRAHDLSTPLALERALWLLNPLKPAPDEWRLRRGDERCTIRVTSRLSSDSTEVAVEGARLGMGIVGIPSFMAPTGDDQLVAVLPEYEVEPELSIYAVYPRRKFVSPRVSAFLSHLERHAASTLAPSRSGKPTDDG